MTAKSWVLTARPVQMPPQGDWRTWLMLGGRGAGKTRTGAEWVRFAALHGGYGRIALIAPTLGDAREVMIEGVSGLRAIAREGEMAPAYEVSRRRLVWPNGAEAHVFSAEDPDSLRGPQFDAAWCDELAAWHYGLDVWDMLQMTLRIGANPRTIATTTPRPIPLIRHLVKDSSVAISRSPTADNIEHLSPVFLEHVTSRYAGTQIGLQELNGELLDNADEALWQQCDLDRAHVSSAPERFSDIIVAVDPPASFGAEADACGIVAVGTVRAPGLREECYVLDDASVQGLTPSGWASRCVATAKSVGARRIVAESNQGGEMVRAVLSAAGADVPVVLTHANLPKLMRAGPVAALYQQGLVKHVGVFAALEEEMLSFGTRGFRGSPDRLDALVWAITAITIPAGAEPSVRAF
ncbi:DNA-packaging protein [Henriciella pelagia]|uniref:DNA-packaging protein n=1 Tax=Henriciella pelagia TaxID=1977912 RepID=A0ABQ1IZV9_9PROT|nr:terminase family protein [Henriciella pelagia]GGB56719.1 DNA-packaging protein [Henriciella pelagia]